MSTAKKLNCLTNFLKRGRVDNKYTRIVQYIATNSDLLDRVRFVDDLRCAPSTLYIAENGAISPIKFNLVLSQAKRVQVFDDLIKGKVPSDKDWLDLIKESRDNSIPYKEAISVLRNYTGELFVKFDFDRWNEVPDWYLEVVEKNPYLERVNSFVESEIKKDRENISKAVDNELRVVLLKQALDEALAERDFERCKEISDLLKRFS